MNLRLVPAIVLALAFAAHAQNAAPPDAQNPGRGMRGGMGAMGGMGRGVACTVTEVAADHYTVKTFTGETYTVHYSANTRFRKEEAGMRGQGGGRGEGQRGGQGMGEGNGGRFAGRQGGEGRGFGAGQPIQSTDIKAGDVITAVGDVDAVNKSIGAMAVIQMDPERARQMQQMVDNFGKTWLMGKVTAISGVQVTLQGSIDNAPHSFVADENTDFRERRNPITLADIHVGDMVRADGALKNGAFTAATVSVMGPPAEGMRGPRNMQSPSPQ